MSTPVTRAQARSSRRARVTRREEILDAIRDAVEGLAEEGLAFSELSVERIAAAAGLSRSSFYRYFADKSELLMSLAEALVTERNEAGLAIWAIPPTAPRATLDEAFAHFLRVCWEHRVIMRAVADAQAYDPTALALHQTVFRDAVAAVSAHIQAGQAGGWVRADAHPELTAEWLVAMNDRGLGALVHVAEGELRQLAQSLSQVVWLVLYEGCRTP